MQKEENTENYHKQGEKYSILSSFLGMRRSPVYNGIFLRKRGSRHDWALNQAKRDASPLHMGNCFLLWDQPLTEPIITPLTKCFCTKGYTASKGAEAMKIRAYFMAWAT